MKKLEKDQLPKVIALGVVATGIVGYAAFNWLGGGRGAAAPAAASTPPPPPARLIVEEEMDRVTQVIPLAPVYNPDPFRPALQPHNAPPPPPPKPPKPAPVARPPKPAPQPKPARVARAPRYADVFDGPSMDGLPGVPPRPPAPAPRPAPPAPPAQPVAPPPPGVVVTGILEGDENVAILKFNDQERQVVRAGDRLEGGYWIKLIRPDSVLITRGKFRWIVRLGADRPVLVQE